MNQNATDSLFKATDPATMNGSEQPFFNTERCNEERLHTAIHCGTLCTIEVKGSKILAHTLVHKIAEQNDIDRACI